MIDYDNQVKIIDFGLSRIFNKSKKIDKYKNRIKIIFCLRIPLLCFALNIRQ
jgi:hypothetical protein